MNSVSLAAERLYAEIRRHVEKSDPISMEGLTLRLGEVHLSPSNIFVGIAPHRMAVEHVKLPDFFEGDR